MKDMFESAEAFEAHATISAGYFMIKEFQEEFEKSSPKYPIDIKIDESTGSAKERLNSHKKNICICLMDIIEAKKLIDADYSNDEKFLNEMVANTL